MEFNIKINMATFDYHGNLFVELETPDGKIYRGQVEEKITEKGNKTK